MTGEGYAQRSSPHTDPNGSREGNTHTHTHTHTHVPFLTVISADIKRPDGPACAGGDVMLSAAGAEGGATGKIKTQFGSWQ